MCAGMLGSIRGHLTFISVPQGLQQGMYNLTYLLKNRVVLHNSLGTLTAS